MRASKAVSRDIQVVIKRSATFSIVYMSSFPIGSIVILQNLVRGSQYNGVRGIVKTNYDANNGGRQNILLPSVNKIVAVKPDNMKLSQVDSNSKAKSGGKSLSNKKKRGQQRKATKSQLSTASKDSVTALEAGPLGLTSEINDRLAAKFVKDIQDGQHIAIESILTDNGSLSFNLSLGKVVYLHLSLPFYKDARMKL